MLSASRLRGLIEGYAARPDEVVVLDSDGEAHGGTVAVGPLNRLLEGGYVGAVRIAPTGRLPFAITGRPEEVREAELALARDLRRESAAKDAPMARGLDRRLSWRISYPLAHTSVTPNEVTFASTALGLLSAWLFASPGYWPRLSAALIFLVSTTLDGVDGELARLKMAESRLGARLDTLTDNLVHVALFAAIMTGCYRASGSRSYLALLLVLVGGFSLCAAAGWWARRSNASPSRRGASGAGGSIRCTACPPTRNGWDVRTPGQLTSFTGVFYSISPGALPRSGGRSKRPRISTRSKPSSRRIRTRWWYRPIATR